MWQHDKGLTELIFVAGLALLPLDNWLWGAGLPALVIASALVYGIAWELPRLVYKRGSALDQLSASWALTLVLVCFYLGKSDRAVAQMIERQGQAAAFLSPLWLVNDGVLLALTVAVMMALLALTTFVLHFFQPSEDEAGTPFWKRIGKLLSRFVVAVFLSTVVGLGGGAWAVLVGNYGLSFGVVTWVTMWVTARASSLRHSSPLRRGALALAVALMGAGLVGGWTRSSLMAMLGGLLGVTIVAAHLGVLSLLSLLQAPGTTETPSALELMRQRPKDAPFHVPWVGFYTWRFAGLVVAFFVVGAGWLWGLR